MTRLPLIFLLMTAASIRIATAQQFDWRSHTSMTNVHSVIIDPSGNYWAATYGGAFRLNPSTGQYDAWRNINALSTTSLNAMAVDPVSGYAAFGGVNGEIDIMTPTGMWRHSLDIKLYEQRKTVNQMLFYDSLLYIATDYGLSTYNAAKFAFINTCKHLGQIPTERRALALAVRHDTLYVGTETGLAFVPIHNPNIADSAFWGLVPTSLLPSPTVQALGVGRQYLYIGTVAGFRAYDDGVIATITGPLGAVTTPITSIAVSGDTAVVTTSNTIFGLVGLNSFYFPVPSTPTSMNAVAYDGPTGTLLIGDAVSGMMRMRSSGMDTLSPNSPGGNIFSSLTFDRNGRLWSGSTLKNGSGVGVFMFNGTAWTTYRFYPGSSTLNDVHAIAADSLNNIWAGTWGAGLWRLRDSGGTISQTRYDNTNSPFRGLSAGSPAYVLVMESVTAPHDIQWIVPYENRAGSFQPQLVAWDAHANNDSGAFYPFACSGVNFYGNYGIALDGAGTKWIAPCPQGRLDVSGQVGLMYYNERGTLNDPSDDVCGVVSTTSGSAGSVLSTNFVTAVKLDNNGELWVGTREGVNIISNPEDALTSPGRLHIRRPTLSVLYGQSANITCMLVDPLNNKWIGTLDAGLFVVDEDGTTQLAHFDIDNSPILSNHIAALAFGKSDGLVYIGTKNGLSTLRASGLAQSVGGHLVVGPQPYFVPSTSPLFIYGVPQDAEAKIFTISGALVRAFGAGELNQIGGIGGWDGKDTRGEIAGSGVYLITYVRADGTSEIAKFAVVRR